MADTIGSNNFVLYNEVSLTQGFRHSSGRHGKRNWAVEETVVIFAEIFLAVYARDYCYK